MAKLSHNLYRAEQVRAMDDYAIHTLGISGTILMERAGEAAFTLLMEKWPAAERITVLCGVGNNGGDGFVVARLAKQAGLDVSVMQIGDVNRLQGDALAAYQRLQSVDIVPVDFNRTTLLRSDVIVDAILGIGLQGEVSADKQEIIRTINLVARPVMALDIPSGLNADSGQVMGQAVKADVTITFIANKRGLYHGDAMDYTGETRLSTLNVPLAVYDQVSNEVERIEYEQFHTLLTPRRRNAHKGDFGHVLIVGGEHGLTGAPRMAGEAAARVGAGLVSIATRHAHAGFMNMSRPELMVHGIEDEASFVRLAERANVIAIGPGLGQSEWARELLNLAIESGQPLVVDADALNVLSQSPKKRNNWVLTPHAGEAARLLGRSCAEIQADRFSSVRELQDTYGGIVALKGAGTLVAATDLPVYLCAQGNPGMASGGMGDVLSGVIAGLIAQGVEPLDAATLGVCLHAAAGDGAALAAGERGMLASDLMSWIRRLANPDK